MEFNSERSIPSLVQWGKTITVFFLGGFLVHMLVMIIDSYLLPDPLYLHLKSDFIGSILSPAMFPMTAVYSFCVLGVYLSWIKAKKATAHAYQKEVQCQEAEHVMQAMQRVTGILVQEISAHNTEIRHWIEARKQREGSVPDRLERSSRKIAETLQTLSEISFVLPYTKESPEDTKDIVKVLETRLGRLES